MVTVPKRTQDLPERQLRHILSESSRHFIREAEMDPEQNARLNDLLRRVGEARERPFFQHNLLVRILDRKRDFVGPEEQPQRLGECTGQAIGA
jgi:hypothetical protein